MMHKLIGYILLVLGLLLIVVPLWQTYNIFTGTSLPPQVFKTEKTETPSANQQPNNPFDIQQQVQKGVMAVLPIDLINNTLNLASWMILMWVLIFGGKQIADIGIRLIKVERRDE